jgi:hypothetical protein
VSDREVPGEHAPTHLIVFQLGVADLAGMEMSQAVALSGPVGLALMSAAGRLTVWLSNGAPACRGIAVVWLVRGVNASDPESGMPAANPFLR